SGSVRHVKVLPPKARTPPGLGRPDGVRLSRWAWVELNHRPHAYQSFARLVQCPQRADKTTAYVSRLSTNRGRLSTFLGPKLPPGVTPAGIRRTPELSLFASIRLEPYRFEAHVRELRAGICRTMGKILGETRVAEPCPECGCGIR